jgi:hypothetical protein
VPLPIIAKGRTSSSARLDAYIFGRSYQEFEKEQYGSVENAIEAN